MNILDRVIGWLAPQWGANRARARAMARHYEAASFGRRTDGWSRLTTDANSAAGLMALPILRAQARDLVRNNPWARHGLRRIVANTVGWGIRPKASGPAAERVAQAWRDWAETTQCDSAGRLTMYGIQSLVMRTVVESGEILIRRRWRLPTDGLAVPLQLQLLEPDFIDTARNGILGDAGGPIIQGIEFDLIGRRAAYWLFDRHPGSILSQGTGASSFSPISKRIPAADVLHVFDQERAGQVRGPSWFASVDVRLHDFAEFEDATLVKAKIASCMAAFVTDTGDGIVGMPGTDSTSKQPTETFEPGMIVPLQPGKQVTIANPPVATDHQSYSTCSLRGIAAGLGTTYEDLTGDYCVAPDTRVLRADLRWVRADELTEGTEIVAFDEEPPGGRGGRRKWRKAMVERSGRRNLNRRRIVTKSATVTVSDEHMFLCTQRGNSGGARGAGLQARSENPETPGQGQRWVRADRLQPGDQIVFLHAPWTTGTTHTHGYLKGIADGEGWVDKGDAKIGIAQNPGPVLDEIGESLASLGFEARLRGGNGGGRVKQWSIIGIGECLRFLGEVRPTRLLANADRIYLGRMIAGGAKITDRPTASVVLAVENQGVGPVVTLATSTRTLITEGLCSHNTQVNYSSGRLARLGHQQDVHHWRWNMLIPQFCAPTWSWMLQALVLAGQEVGTTPAAWHPAPMPMLDVDKESKAYQQRVRNGQMTWQQMVRELGEDPDQMLDEIQELNAELDRRGIALDCDPRRMSAGGLVQQVWSSGSIAAWPPPPAPETLPAAPGAPAAKPAAKPNGSAVPLDDEDDTGEVDDAANA